MAQDIRDKIAKLLALADSPSEAEARAALLKARELMAKHKLRPEEIKKAENVKVIKETIGVSCTGMTDPWMPNLTAVIAGHYCCCSFRQTIKGKKTKHIGLVGLEDDFAICKSVVLYAIDCIQATKKGDRGGEQGAPADLYQEDVQRLRLGLHLRPPAGLQGSGPGAPGMGTRPGGAPAGDGRDDRDG